uniref:Uncharacterized protein n=1 Tax=Heterorhabditis bacteriophora TaxID=37862 RepID=A0A1I7WQ39_HETBA
MYYTVFRLLWSMRYLVLLFTSKK